MSIAQLFTFLFSVFVLSLNSCTDVSSAALYPAAHFPYQIDTQEQSSHVVMADGEELGFYHIQPSTEIIGSVIYFHGNAERAVDNGGVKNLYPSGYQIFLYEYPGYFENQKKPQQKANEAIIRKNVEVFFQHIQDDLVRPVFVHGRSIGTAIATHVASTFSDKVSGLILTSPFTSISEVAARVFPPAGLLTVGNHWVTSDMAPRVTAPVLALHGNRDELIPYEMGLRQAALFINSSRVDFVSLDDLGHNFSNHILEYQNAIKTFFNSVLEDSP